MSLPVTDGATSETLGPDLDECVDGCGQPNEGHASGRCSSCDQQRRHEEASEPVTDVESDPAWGRTILVHLNVEARSDDPRTADEIARDVMGGLEVAGEDSPLTNLEIVVALAEEV